MPYIGAAAAQAGGFDGTGIDVAVIDSGIDYTHQNFGGPGTVAAYKAAYGTDDSRREEQDARRAVPDREGRRGFDFVGESWPTKPGAGSRMRIRTRTRSTVVPRIAEPDPRLPPAVPNCAGGHGSHVVGHHPRHRPEQGRRAGREALLVQGL